MPTNKTPKAPQDHQPKVTADRFEWTAPRELGTVRLPKFNRLKFGVMRRIRKLSEDDLPFFLVEELADEDELVNIIDELELDEVGELFKAWQEDSGLDLGESPAS